MRIITDDLEKSNVLNRYFCSIQTVDDSNIELPKFISRTDASFQSPTITETDVSDILGNLKLGKATGCDRISHNMLKATRHSVCKPLAILFNSSLTDAIFPNLWKNLLFYLCIKREINTTYQIIDQFHLYLVLVKFLNVEF